MSITTRLKAAEEKANTGNTLIVWRDPDQPKEDALANYGDIKPGDTIHYIGWNEAHRMQEEAPASYYNRSEEEA